MNMKKKLLLSMILLALCLIQASAGTYYFKIRLSDVNGNPEGWSSYIKVEAVEDGKDADGNTKYKYPNGLTTLFNGGTVTDEQKAECKLYKKADNTVDLDRIYGIVFANGKGRFGNTQENILEGDDWNTWLKIRKYVKHLELREYIRDTYTGGSGYFMDMDKLEKLELPKNGMNVGTGDEDCQYYFANAHKLNTIYIYSENHTDDKVEITDDTDNTAKNKKLLDRVGKFMFANCWALSTKYINRLIKDVSEIKDNAFKVDPGNRQYCPDETDNTIIDIPSTVTKIGSLAFWNRVKVTGLNIQGNGDGLEIGSEAFRGCEQLNALTLDNAKITSLGTGVFGDCRAMTNDFVNRVLTNYAEHGGTKIPAYLFFGCNGQDGHDGSDTNKNKCSFTKLNIPLQFTEIGDGAFASTGDAKIKLETITVNRDVAPTCLKDTLDAYAGIKNKSVFDGLKPNLTTVVFATDAEGWEKTETTGFLTYMNDRSEFQRLLTKDIYSDSTKYINVKQQHAIVRLHRTLKEGWNTICLPFGVNYRYCSWWGEDYKDKQACNARIIVNGLTNNDKNANGNNFKMGVYRGYWKDGKTFMFLHYTGFDEYPLDLGETFLVYMRPEDIANAEKVKNGADIYTFRNVDLNYRWTADGKDGNDGEWTSVTYSADQMLQQVKDFDGSVNTTDTPFNGKASYNEYELTGSFVQRTGTVGDSQGIITTDDYFFQQSQNGKMKLYPYPAGQKYGIRGFSGWFHKKDKSNAKPSELSLGLFDDNSTTPIETVKVDDLNRDTSGKVYSISGVLVKNNAADLNNLPKGIYVVNGKKYVVK